MAGQVDINYSHSLALMKVPSDEYAEQLTEQTTSGVAYQTAQSLTFTPATTGDYIIFAQCYGAIDTAGRIMNLRLDVDGTTYMARKMQAAGLGSTLERRTHGWLKKVNLDATSHTIKIEFNSQTAGTTVRCGDITILAMRFDSFHDADYEEDVTTRTTTAVTPSYTTRHSWTYATPGTTAGDYLCMGMIVSANGTPTASVRSDEVLVGGTLRMDQTYNSNAAGSNDSTTYLFAFIENLSASTVFLNQVNKSAGGVGTGSVTTTATSFFCARVPRGHRLREIGGHLHKLKWEAAAAA